MVIPKVQNERPYLVVDSPNVVNNGNELIAQYIYRRNHIEYSSNGQGIMVSITTFSDNHLTDSDSTTNT